MKTLYKIDVSGNIVDIDKESMSNLMNTLYDMTDKYERLGFMHIDTFCTPNILVHEFSHEEGGWCFALLIADGRATLGTK